MMILPPDVEAAFLNGKWEEKNPVGTFHLARFFDSKNEKEARENPSGHWWVYIPKHMATFPETAKHDIRSAMAEGFKDGARKLLAIQKEWSDMRYWTHVITYGDLHFAQGKAAAQGKLEGGWMQMYFPDPKVPVARGSVECVAVL
jgi:hypothetical protein